MFEIKVAAPLGAVLQWGLWLELHVAARPGGLGWGPALLVATVRPLLLSSQAGVEGLAGLLSHNP